MRKGGRKRGPKPLGGKRIILRLLKGDLEIVDKQVKKTGLPRYVIIQNAVRKVYGDRTRRIR